MKETIHRARKATFVVVGTLIAFVAITSWISGITSHFDESNTFVYEGALSHVECSTVRKLRWGCNVYYTLCFVDGQRFSINPNDAGALLNNPARTELMALSKGAKLTVVVSQRYGDVCAFWTDERVFISLDDCNKHSSKNKMYLYVLDASLFIVAVFVEGLCTFDTFRQLYISISAQRRKSIRKRARRTLRDNSKENTKRTK